MIIPESRELARSSMHMADVNCSGSCSDRAKPGFKKRPEFVTLESLGPTRLDDKERIDVLDERFGGSSHAAVVRSLEDACAQS